jgi:FecR-like protein
MKNNFSALIQTKKTMKPIYFNIIFTLFSIFSMCLPSGTAVYSQTKGDISFYSGSHDTLIFDGASDNSSFIKTVDACKLKVTSVSGIAIGTRCHTETYTACGSEVFEEEVCKTGQIFPDDKLKAGDKISTGPNGYMTVMLSDGKTIRFGHNTSIVINSNYCTNNFKTEVMLGEGEIFVNAKPNKDVKGINVTTDYGTALIEGTEFSYEIIKDGDLTTNILKVYDGSVKFQKNMENKSSQKKADDKAAEMKKLTDDFQSGKISIDEFTKRMQVLQQDFSETVPQNAITVNAGYESRIVGTENPTEPASFDTKGNRWWEDK